MAFSKGITIEVLAQFIEVYSNVGDRKISLTLENCSNINFTQFVIDTTMGLVCKHFAICQDELLFGESSKEGTRINALAVFVLLTRQHIYLSYSELMNILHKNTRSVISKYVTIANSYDEKIPEHKEVLRKLCLIKAELKEQIDLYNNNSKKQTYDKRQTYKRRDRNKKSTI
jgi:septum formation topological specificity factor MinE